MAGPGTTFTGPIISGTKWYADGNGPANTGLCQLAQVSAPLVQNGAATVSATFAVPAGSIIHDIIVDTTTAWNAGTASVLTVGLTAGGTDFASAVSVQTAGRARPTFTAAQLANMLNTGFVGNGATIYATIAPSGTAPTAGSTTVTLEFIQTVQS